MRGSSRVTEGRQVTVVINGIVVQTLTGCTTERGDHRKHPGTLTSTVGITGLWYAVRTA